MRRILAVCFVLVLALGLAPNATASHENDACITSGLIVTETMGAMCPLILNCPAASLTCTWDINVTANGLGYLRVRVIDIDTGQTLMTCGPELLECVNTAPFSLSPTGVNYIECWLFGGETHPALIASLDCTATATGHVG